MIDQDDTAEIELSLEVDYDDPKFQFKKNLMQRDAEADYLK